MTPSFQVKILQRHWLSTEIMELTCEKPFDFLAGQYTFIEHEGERHPFSIASAPFETTLRFQMQHSERRPMQESLWQQVKNGEFLSLTPPQGEAYLRLDSPRPLLLIAGGSGFSPIHSIISTLAHHQSQRPIRLYWGVQNHSFIYDLKSLQQWQTQLPDFKWTLVLSEPTINPQGIERKGLVHHAVLEDQLPLKDYDIYIAGPFALSQVAQADFARHCGASLKIYSDALTPT